LAFQKKFTARRRFMLVATIKECMRPVDSPFGTSGQCHIGSDEQMFGAE
jgi:hypothetical protein